MFETELRNGYPAGLSLNIQFWEILKASMRVLTTVN